MFNTPEGNRLLRYGSVALIVLAIFLGIQALYSLRLFANVGRSTPAMNVITVSGMGEVMVTPDIATFSFGAQETAATVADAQKKVTDTINKALEIVKNSGVDEKDIKTTGYYINPHYTSTGRPCTQFSCPPSDQIVSGYDVSQTVEVKVRDTNKAGKLLGDLGSVQVNNLSGLTFTVDKPEDKQAEARALAIKDAREKAKVLAHDLGVSLGDIVSFGDNNGGYPVPMYMDSFKAGNVPVAQSAPEVQIPVGEGKVVSNVTITYEIH